VAPRESGSSSAREPSGALVVTSSGVPARERRMTPTASTITMTTIAATMP
jgi:hypothetical protein